MLLEHNIALIGFMTAGKTQVGLRLAQRTGMPFIDIDHLIAQVEQRSVEEIFRVKGEPYFRTVESRVLAELCQGRGQIIGCGGGTILVEGNRERLRARCVTVWLRVSQEEVLLRLEDPDAPRRPLVEGVDPGEIVRRLMAQREPLYAEAAHIVDTDGRGVDEVAEEIVLRLGLPTVGDVESRGNR